MSRHEGNSNPLICYSVFVEHWLWRYKYFLSKINIRNDNYVRATAFIFDTRTDVLVKVSKYKVYEVTVYMTRYFHDFFN